MPALRALRTMNAIEAGTLTGAALQTYLSDATLGAGRLADFNMLINARGHARRMASSATAMAAVAASSTAMAAVSVSSSAMAAVAASISAMAAVAASGSAMAAVIASSTAMAALNANDQAVRIWMLAGTGQNYASFANVAAVAASSSAMAAVAASISAMAAVAASGSAMAAVWASNTAADAVLTSATTRLAVYNADTALAALQANPTQVARQIGIGGRTTSASTAVSAFIFVANNTKVILLRRYYGGTEYDCIDWARGSTTSGAGVIAGSGGRTLDTGAQALGCTSGTYNSNGIMPSSNDDTANFVSSANGLQRRAWVFGSTLYVNYITV